MFSCENKQETKGQVNLENSELVSFAPNPVIEKLLTSTGFDYNIYKTAENWSALAAQIYDRPNAKTLVQNVKFRHPDKSHPRILITASSLKNIKEKHEYDLELQRKRLVIDKENALLILRKEMQKDLVRLLLLRLQSKA